MLEDEKVSCPFCGQELDVKALRAGRKPTYLVPQDCLHCKAPAGKIEKSLNGLHKSVHVKVERSYLKTKPRG